MKLIPNKLLLLPSRPGTPLQYPLPIEMVNSPINLLNWIKENKEKLQPPVGNFLIQKGDFIVMVVGGPNARSDFHINPTEA
jgi:hypothetical protein